MAEWLASFPDVVWAALLASLLTLSGVLLANRSSRIRQIAELKHDASQRDREREMALRRDVYLGAAGAISRAQSMLMRLADLNVADQELSAAFSRDSSAMAQVHVVGTNKTVQAISAFSQELGAAFLELTLKRLPLLERKNQIELLGKFIDKSNTEQERLINIMRQLNLEGNTDQKTWGVVNDSFKFEQQKNAENMEERQALTNQQHHDILEFLELSFDRFCTVSRLVPPAIFAVREELDLPLDREAYTKMFDENLEKGKDNIQGFLQGLNEAMNE